MLVGSTSSLLQSGFCGGFFCKVTLFPMVAIINLQQTVSYSGNFSLKASEASSQKSVALEQNQSVFRALFPPEVKGRICSCLFWFLVTASTPCPEPHDQLYGQHLQCPLCFDHTALFSV